MEEAQSLDTADRYINARCTKFMVEAHRQNDALAMASKFTRVRLFVFSAFLVGDYICCRLSLGNAVHVVPYGECTHLSRYGKVWRVIETLPRSGASKLLLNRCCRKAYLSTQVLTVHFLHF